ncbi:MAG: MBL fold metallo-hydrolase [Thermoguttaceae bacterium]
MGKKRKAPSKANPAGSGRQRPAPNRKPRRPRASGSGRCEVHLIDVGETKYGECALCVFGDKSILIDGGHSNDFDPQSTVHKSIPAQLTKLLGTEQIHVDLLVVTHAHDDHIGCLPEMVQSGDLTADWALVIDPDKGWPEGSDAASMATTLALSNQAVRQVVAALREDTIPELADDADVAAFMARAAALQPRYEQMLDTLNRNGTNVIKFPTTSMADLLEAMKDVGLSVIGPTKRQVDLAAAAISKQTTVNAVRAHAALSRLPSAMAGKVALDGSGTSQSDMVVAYRQLLSEDAATEGVILTSDDQAVTTQAATAMAQNASRSGAAVNDQSIVTLFEFARKKFLFNGDMQLVSPGVRSVKELNQLMGALRDSIAAEAPFAFYKLGHHGSNNAMNATFFNRLGGTVNFGIITGVQSPGHPNPQTLDILEADADHIHWARTDKNGPVAFLWLGDDVTITPTIGELNDDSLSAYDAANPSGGRPADEASLLVAKLGITALSASLNEVPNGDIHLKVPSNATRVTVTFDIAR